MANYAISLLLKNQSEENMIEKIKTQLGVDGYFTGIGMGKRYEIDRISANAVYYIGKDRSGGNVEEIAIADLKAAISILKSLDVFNTNTQELKDNIPRSIYRKRSPLFGILFHCGIIVKV
jgi:hypothetical protein